MTRKHSRGKSHGKNYGRKTHKPYVVGTVRICGKGGFVDTPEGTFKLSHSGVREAMNGDTVAISVVRGQHGDKCANVMHVVERATTQIVGVFDFAGALGVVEPLDGRIKHDFFVLPDDESPFVQGVSSDDVVSAQIVSYPNRYEAGVVTIARRIGTLESLDLGIQVVMANHDLVDEYPAAALEEAQKLELDVDCALKDPIRRDITQRFVVTIDPTDARDYDDAISIEKTKQGGYKLGIHIADVSHYVGWESSIDLAARDRATSVYLADRVLPMLPERLCNNLCSLVPGERRLAFSVDVVLDRHARVTSYDFYPSVIESKLRLDYATADAVIAHEIDAPVSELAPHVDVQEFLELASELAEKRVSRRRERGAIDFSTSEIRAVLNEEGEPVAISSRERTLATGLVEEAMLIANECVAEKLVDAKQQSAYRVHDTPAIDSLADAASTLHELGVISMHDMMNIASGDCHAIEQALLAAEDTRYKELANALLLRSMSRAIYKPQNQGHYALGAPAYCHFTSPIRRYPDLLVHRSLKRLLYREAISSGVVFDEQTVRAACNLPQCVTDAKRKKALHPQAGEETLVVPYTQINPDSPYRQILTYLVGRGKQSMDEILPHLCKHASQMERNADAASMDSQKVKIAQYYAARIGERYCGKISWASEIGLFVRMDDTGAEGLVRMKNIGGHDYWEFDAARLCIQGTSTGRMLELGQSVIVEVIDANPVRGHVDLALIHQMSTVN